MGVYKITSPIVDPEVLEDLDNPEANRGGDSNER